MTFLSVSVIININDCNINNYNNIKEQTMFYNKFNSKTVLMFSSKTLKLYYVKIE